MRLTCGTYDNGKKFTHFSHWRKDVNTKDMTKPWTGATVFVDENSMDPDATASVRCAMHHTDELMPQKKTCSN